jgi:hydroxyethylthiazole kinase-like uncharacterized protein yjeF
MMRIVTNAEMRNIDTRAMQKLGIPSTVLMENAGRGCVDVIENYFDPESLKVCILCGKGNNGGDGFVIARHLQNRGAEVEIILLGKATSLKGDSRINYALAKKSGLPIHEFIEPKTIKRTIDAFAPGVIVDAVFGTGFKGSLQPKYRAVFDIVNSYDAFVLSVDIPSGINGDNGQCDRTCIVADATAAMCLPKRGHYLYPGRELCGDVFVVDIGVPYTLINSGFPRIPTFQDVLAALPVRKPDGHKGSFGTVLTVAGARGFSGAAAMAATSSLKTGAGLVRLAIPKGIADAIESKLLEVVKIPLPQTADETIDTAALTVLTPHFDSDVIVVGPGITTHPQTAEFLVSFVSKITSPLIIDADAINILAGHKHLLKKCPAPCVLTPHPGELSRLTGLPVKDINLNRLDLAPQLARTYNCVMVLKGAPTVIASPDGSVYLNPTGNSGLSSAGSGDVLVGMIAGFIAQHVSLVESAMLGAFLHGLCSELAMERNNEYSLMAGDLIEHIPEAINYVLNREYAGDND